MVSRMAARAGMVWSFVVAGGAGWAAAAELAPIPAGPLVIRAADAPAVSMAEWEIIQTGAAEQTGARVLIAAGAAELARAPPEAVRYTSRTYRFRNGSLRVLEFTRAAGGVLHQITSETQLYVIRGSATVGVRGESLKLEAGDVVSLPSGVLRSVPGRAEDTAVLLQTVRLPPTARAMRVPARDARPVRVASVDATGRKRARVQVQRYTFDGNSIRVAKLTGPGRTDVVRPPVDAMIYLLSGRMRITLGDEQHDVGAGDALVEPAGMPTYWDVEGVSTFVATSTAEWLR
jgi:quercetin dioxygenase-like cupin family protein